MSSASPFRRSPLNSPHSLARSLETALATSLRAAGFWSAVALPFVLLGMLVSGAAAQHTLPFAALLAGNLLALRLGHAHNRD